MTTREPPTKAVHTWSLFRTLGRYVAPGSMPSGALPEGGGSGLDLLDLPRALADHGYRSVQLCHFSLRDRSAGYLAEVRDAFAAADVAIEALLVDDGDLTHATDDQRWAGWVDDWLAVAEHLGAARARVVAGQQPPSPDTLSRSARHLVRLADEHPDLRLVTENWHRLLPDAASVSTLLEQTDGRVGFLVDLGNWTGPTRLAELAAVAPLAESCQAKVRTDDTGALDTADYRASLRVLLDAGYTGPLAVVHDGPDPDEWQRLEEAHAVVSEVFGQPRLPR